MSLSKKSKEKNIQSFLIHWYKNNKRNLLWRKIQKNNLPRPYYVFVSEYMLQQTTVGTVKNRFKEFILNWPSINALANASEEKILIFWAGLGYYSRARNLHKASRIIKNKYKSKIPNNYSELIKLPGIGDYTAKAILGIAYNQPFIPLDANIERILSRLYGLQKPLLQIKKELNEKSNLFISKNFSSELIQAFMDYGSEVCLPRKPKCDKCLISNKCISYKKNLQNIVPIKTKYKIPKIKKYTRAYILYNEKNEILIRKRSPTGMLASMFEVPNDNWEIDKKKLIKDKIALKAKNKMSSKGLVNYSFSHFDLETEVFFINVKKNIFRNQKWIKKNKVKSSGLPTVMKKIVEAGL